MSLLKKIRQAEQIISDLMQELPTHIAKGSGPFLAAIYDETNTCIAKAANTVVTDNCSNNHAEINAIAAAQKTLVTYDLAPYSLSLYVTSEPCMMCLGAIMWSGIRAVYFSVPSKTVERITGFDEGFKPNWIAEFQKRGITVHGGILEEKGTAVLADYVKSHHPIYKPKR